MLIIPYYVAPSRIHGMGVFSAVDVRGGDPVWRYDPERDLVITLDEFAQLSRARKRDVANHAQWYPDQGKFVLGPDGDYFMNHADEPTLIDRGETMIAAQRLLKGTELTCDYRAVLVLGFPVCTQVSPTVDRWLT